MSEEYSPLADRIRPKDLSEFVGQDHLVGEQGIIKKFINSDQIPSMIFWGPPGSGKTTLARVIANTTKSHFVNYSAVNTTLADVRKVIAQAKERLKAYNQKTILFLDEIHRFNKAQQDAFLPNVENGTIILIGATTENPSFEVIGPLLSRCRVFVLYRLEKKELNTLVDRTLKVLGRSIKKDARKFLLEASNGDARILINALEITHSLITDPCSPVTLGVIREVFQKRSNLYDRAGEEHYNTISAYIKSLRAGDVDAALYYLARMVEAGEDPLFIARRMVIFASEDVGMAQPTALVVANEVFRACDAIGYPECAINLAHGTVYLASAKKDRSAYNAYSEALKDVQRHGNLPIPLQILNPVTKLMKEIGYGNGYRAYPKKGSSYLPEKLKGKKYYQI